ncbi:MAG TPA: ATP-binding cassette domain-containing protein [Virgibacillus sp.]|nr:ATP-binding cassette domain-containing protein [Virgibacillus sp.]HLR66855.1 ATP-binding cassette domain-containing protein [Virgibacillus sp.]
MEAVLSLKNIQKSFKAEQILHGISFEVNKGEIMALLGPNGAGKSTTIRSIMEILYPDKGSIYFHLNQSGKICRNKIGYLPEERGLYKNVKVLDMLLYLAELKDYPLKEAKNRALYYLDKFGLSGKENVAIEELSKGMAQKVQFIGTVIHEPELLILDEPFSGLDPVSQELLKQEVREIAQAGTAIILSSHQMNLVEEVCHRIFLIHKGKRVLYGTLDEIKTAYANVKCIIYGENDRSILDQIHQVAKIEYEEEKVVLYLKNNVEITPWLRALPEQLQIKEMSMQRVSLHEIFIDIATKKNDIEEGVYHA